jgi:two-component system, chemotaxis family, sensor kinase Cph1
MKRNSSPQGPEDLRARAEESLKYEPDRPDDMCLEDAKSLIHELRVHQIELEMQNEELRRVQNDLEISRSRYADLYDFAPVGYLTLNKDSRIVDLNLTAARQLGIERGHLLDRHFQYFVFQPDKKEFLSHLNAVFEKQERQIAEVRLSPKDGEQFHARLESIYMEGEDGAGLCRTNISDVTLRKRAEQVLQNAHDELECRVDERTIELSQAVAKLGSMNEELREFAYIASHDLQEPLRKIQTFGNMLTGKHKESLDPEGRDYMERIIKAAKRMSELLQSLLDYSRSGTSVLNYKRVSLTEVAKDAASDLELLIYRCKGRVEISELPTVDADPALLRQLFQNVISNSIKYRKESEPLVVRIYGTIAGATCQVMIEDNGIGFREEYRNKIFKPFERLHGMNSPYGGTGMGLAICRKIVNRHGGEISVRSMPEQGTTFIVTLPIEQKTAA